MELIKAVDNRGTSIRIWPVGTGNENGSDMNATIHFLTGNTQAVQRYYEEHGFRDDIVIELNRYYFEVYFYTPSAVEREMRNKEILMMPGLILMDAISNNKIYAAIDFLIESGYFAAFKGTSEFPLNKRFNGTKSKNEFHIFDFSEVASHKINQVRKQ